MNIEKLLEQFPDMPITTSFEAFNAMRKQKGYGMRLIEDQPFPSQRGLYAFFKSALTKLWPQGDGEPTEPEWPQMKLLELQHAPTPQSRGPIIFAMAIFTRFDEDQCWLFFCQPGDLGPFRLLRGIETA